MFNLPPHRVDFANTEKTRGNRYKLHNERFHLDVRDIFTVGAVSCWDNLPRAMVECPSLDVFQLWSEEVLSDLVQAPFSHEGKDLLIFQILFHPVTLKNGTLGKSND